MFRVVKFLFRGKNLKFSLAVLAIVISTISGLVVYSKNLSNQVNSLREDNTIIRQSNTNLQAQLQENLRGYQRDIAILNDIFSQYSQSIRENEKRTQELNNILSGINDEQINQCLDTSLPNELINRLFGTTPTDRESRSNGD